MAKYLISFPSEAMIVTDEELPFVAEAAVAVIEEAKAAGVYVFGGGIDEQVAPVLVSADGTASPEIYAGSKLTGGFTVLELPTRDDAIDWARRIAIACRCAQELRRIHVPSGELTTGSSEIAGGSAPRPFYVRAAGRLLHPQAPGASAVASAAAMVAWGAGSAKDTGHSLQGDTDVS